MIGFNRNSLAHCLEQTINLKSFPTKTNSPFLRQIPASGVNNGEYTPLCMQPQPNESTYLAKGIEVAGTLRWWRLVDRWTGYTVTQNVSLDWRIMLNLNFWKIFVLRRWVEWTTVATFANLSSNSLPDFFRSELLRWRQLSPTIAPASTLLSSWGDCWGVQLYIKPMFVGWISR